MYVRTLKEIIGTKRDVNWGNGQSRRLLVESDNMGFALLDTIIKAGTDLEIQYNNHLEAVYCIEGRGSITDVATHKVYDIDVICVFNPPIKGDEKHEMSKPGTSY
jgi:L-ectoine synthase